MSRNYLKSITASMEDIPGTMDRNIDSHLRFAHSRLVCPLSVARFLDCTAVYCIGGCDAAFAKRTPRRQGFIPAQLNERGESSRE